MIVFFLLFSFILQKTFSSPSFINNNNKNNYFRKKHFSIFEDPHARTRWTKPNSRVSDWKTFPIQEENCNALSAYENGKYYVLLGDSSVWIFKEKEEEWYRIDPELNIIINENMNIFVDDDGLIILSGGDVLYKVQCSGEFCRKEKEIKEKFGKVNKIAKIKTYFWIASTEGLFLYGDEDIKKIDGIKSANSVASTSVNDEYYTAVGTDEKLYFFKGINTNVDSWLHFWVGIICDDAITALEFEKTGQNLWIGNNRSISKFIVEDMISYRIGGRKGLPFGSITTISSSEKRVFFGSQKGMITFDIGKESFSYQYKDRYIPGEWIKSIHPIDDSSVLVMSETGASLIEWKKWTLEDKAKHYEEIVRPRHFRMGLTSDCKLEKYADLSSYKLKDSDNDGLWTSIYLTSQIFRYKVTQEKDAKENAQKAFRALEILNEVTGTEGFFARSFLEKEKEPQGHGEWVNSTTYPDLQFKADTSSDEVIGHVVAYILYYDLLAENTTEKNRAKKLLLNHVNYIIKNDYYLIDPPKKKPTKWGVWNPEMLNNNPDWREERGLNSLQILGIILNAYRISNYDEKYLESFRYLINKGYDINILNQKVESPDRINHSDDELSYLAYYCLYYALEYLKDSEFDKLRVHLKKSIEKNYQYTESENIPWFNVIYSIISEKEIDFESSIKTLQEYPQELISYPIQNSHRFDIETNPEPWMRQTMSVNENMKILPYNERGLYRWNGNAHGLDGGNGMSEIDPGAWLISYWISRYYDFI